jgi:hypothetical protein
MKKLFTSIFLVFSISLLAQIEKVKEYQFYLPDSIISGNGNYKVLGNFGNNYTNDNYYQHLRFQNNSSGNLDIFDFICKFNPFDGTTKLIKLGNDTNHQNNEFGYVSDYDVIKTTKIRFLNDSLLDLQTTFNEFILPESEIPSQTPLRISSLRLTNEIVTSFDTSSFLPTGLFYIDDSLDVKIEKSRTIDSLFYIKLKVNDTIQVIPFYSNDTYSYTFNSREMKNPPIWKKDDALYFFLYQTAKIKFFKFNLVNYEISVVSTINFTNYSYYSIGYHRSSLDDIIELFDNSGQLFFYKVNYNPFSFSIYQLTEQSFFSRIERINEINNSCNESIYYFGRKFST